MSEQVQTSTKQKGKRGGLFPPQSLKSMSPKQQIDIGDYVIFKGEDRVAEVFVELDPMYENDPTHTIEHWCLYDIYTPPSSTNDDVALRVVYGEGTYADAEDFLDYVRNLEDIRYIKAVCREQAP